MVFPPPGNDTSDLGVSQQFINAYKQCSDVSFSVDLDYALWKCTMANPPEEVKKDTLKTNKQTDNKIVSQPKITSGLN